jgi:hypothetical protein
MSLIVTSNIALEDRPETSEAFKPYSYQNRLLNTFKIPPNSEIALQSAKINKNGLFVVDRANSGFAHYFGVPQDDNLDETTMQPFPAVIGAGEAFRAGGKTELNVDDMADEINKGINRATFHPSLITGANTTGIAVVPKYASSGLSFEGFKFTCTQQTAKTTRSAASINWTDVSRNNQYNFTQVNGTVTSTDANGFYVQNREYPISQNNGSATFDFSDANTGSWMVGLSRINTQRENALGGWDYLPDYFNTEVSQALLQGVFKKDQFTYADIAVVRQGDNLRVYQSGARTAAGNGDGIYMNEVTYYGAYNASFSAIYNLATNDEGYDKVTFELENEEIKIYMKNSASGTSDLLADFTTLSGAGAVKNECLNPINAAKWALYPVCAASGGAAGGKDITLDSIDHYTNYPSYAVPSYINYDWWGYSQFNNLTRWCKELEMRDWNNYNRTTSGTLGNGLLTPKGVNAGGGMDDYENTLITVRSDVYGDEITANCNTANTLGFVGMPVSQPSTSPAPTNVQIVIESNSVPKLISNVSLFIRLNNFTQNSVNARQGTNSKIVAHLPRFDNSGNETGGLYFEPHEKTYLKLNNTEELLINSFDVDFVYDNETLCSALTGKTIVVFHIRESK